LQHPASDCQKCRLANIMVPCPKQADDGEPCLICKGTGSRTYRHNVLWVDGPVPNDILLLGEAPGNIEDIEGLPFRPTAPAGRVLHHALAEVGLDPAIDNVVRCRPPDNNLKDFPDALVICRDAWLPYVLAQVQPKVIVVLGALAGGAWFPGIKATPVSRLARVCVMGSWRGIIVGSFHPSYVARGSDPTAWPSLLASLRRAMTLVDEVF
jgi:uracil-DNA glycosylase family 4